MSEADGRVYIDTEIQTDGFEAGSKDIEAAARSMAKTVNNIGESAKIALQKQTDAFVKQNQMLARQKAKVKELEEEYVRLSEQKIETDEFKEIGKQIDSDTIKLNRLEKAQNEFLAVGSKTDSKAYQKRKLQIDELKNSIRHAKGEQQELLSSGGAYKNADTRAIQKKLSVETERLAQMNNALDTSYMSLKEKVTSYGGRVEYLTGIKGKVINSFKKFGNEAKNIGKRLLGLDKEVKKNGLSMKRMLATSLLMGVAFQAFSTVMEGVKTGMNNLAKYSKETNADMSALKSSLTQLKNSFATAFAPLLSVVTPALIQFLNLISKVVSYIGMLGAALSGKKSFTKAVEVQEDYAASLSNTASSAEDAEKAMQGYLSPLDEINKMDAQNTNTSTGSSAGNIPVGEMFETEEIDSSIINLAESFKTKFAGITSLFKDFGTEIKEATSDWISALNRQPLTESLDMLLEEAEPLLGILLDGLAWGYKNILLPFGKWTIEKGLPALIEALAKAFELLVVVLKLLNPLFEFLWKNIIEPFGVAVGEIVLGIIEIFNGLTDFLIGIFTGDWQRAFAGLQDILGGFLDIVNAVFGFIEKSIIIPFDNFLQNVFTTDWSVAFGIVGDGLNRFLSSVRDIWNGIKDIFYGIITFINGVFTGDWEKAWEGVQQIFKGIFEGLVGIVKYPINEIIALLNGLISGIVSGVNTVIEGINIIDFDVPDWVPVFGGKSVDFNIPTMTAPKIPYLATGAVIPPNAPFMAVLGDQKQGTNIETPEKLLRQIMREELGNKRNSGGTYKFIGQINRRVLFEEMITEAKLRQSQNGRNPFELA